MTEKDTMTQLTDRAVYVTWTKDRVRYSDLDPNGHVNNGAINQFFEDGRVHFREARMSTGGAGVILAGFVVVRFACVYHAELGYPGEVEIGTVILRVGNSSYTLGQGVFAGDTCIATAEVVTVCVDPATKKTKPIEGKLRDALESSLLKA